MPNTRNINGEKKDRTDPPRETIEILVQTENPPREPREVFVELIEHPPRETREILVQTENQWDYAVREALRYLTGFEKRYGQLTEIAPVMEAIRRVRAERDEHGVGTGQDRRG